MDPAIAATPDLAARFDITLPSGFGYDFAGRVDEVGEGAARFTLGERVYGGVMETSQRPETVGTDKPSACHLEIAARASPAVRLISRRRPMGSATRALRTEACEITVAGFQRCGARLYRSKSSEVVNRAPSDVMATRVTPPKSTSSRLRRWAYSASPWTLNDR
jgi:threonine dehydrogenase-like Zn-dependent dehydrogenase